MRSPEVPAPSPVTTKAPRIAALYPILFAAYAVLFMYSSNLGDVDLGQLWRPLALAVIGSAILLGLAWALVRDLHRAALVVGALTLVFFGFRHVALLAADTPLDGLPLVVASVGVVAAAVVVAWRGGRWLHAVTRLAATIGTILVIVAVVTIVPFELGQPASTPEDAAPSAPAAAVPPPADARDIWFIVLDRYGSTEAMRLDYGIENDFPAWLTSQGFQVADRAHANYFKTSHSIAGTLNLDYLDDFSHDGVAKQLTDHEVGRFLTGHGYRYVHIASNFTWTATSPYATVTKRLDQASDLEVALVDSTLAPSIGALLSPGEVTELRQRQYDWVRFGLDALEDARTEAGPKFVFAHLLLPHPPYVFAADGRLIPDAEHESRTTAEAYEAQLLYANDRLRGIIEPLVTLPEAERPIIVVAADEGPYPARYEVDRDRGSAVEGFDWSTATDEEIAIKFGILNAFYLPGAPDDLVYPTITPVNTFRLLLSQYFGADLPLLPDRTLAPPASGTGPLVDLTERLNGPG